MYIISTEIPAKTYPTSEIHLPVEKAEPRELKSTWKRAMQYIEPGKKYFSSPQTLFNLAVASVTLSVLYLYYRCAYDSNSESKNFISNGTSPIAGLDGFRYEGEEGIASVTDSPEIMEKFELIHDVIKQAIDNVSDKFTGFCAGFGEIVCQGVTRIQYDLIDDLLFEKLPQEEIRKIYTEELSKELIDIVDNVNRTEQPESLLEAGLDGVSASDAHLFTPMDLKYLKTGKFPNIMYCSSTIARAFSNACWSLGKLIPFNTMYKIFFRGSLDPAIREHARTPFCLKRYDQD